MKYSMRGEQQNKENKNENLQTSTSEGSEYQLKNPFMKIGVYECHKQGSSSFLRDKQQIALFSQDQSQDKEIIPSMERRFKLQLQKQKQLYSILQSNLKQEIEFLASQNQILKLQNINLKKKFNSLVLTSELQQQKLQADSPFLNNQLSNIRSMLSVLQKQHQNCISNKKKLMDTKQTLEMKIIILEKQNRQLEAQFKDFKGKLQNLGDLQMQNANLKNEVQSLRKQVNCLRVLNRQQEKQFNKQLSSLQKDIQEVQSKTAAQQAPQNPPICFRNEQLKYDNKSNGSGDTQKSFDPKNSYDSLLSKHTKSSKVSETKILPPKYIPKSSSVESDIDYLQAKNILLKNKVIDKIYKPNLSLLTQKNQRQSLNNRESNYQHKLSQTLKDESCIKRAARKIEMCQVSVSGSAKNRVESSSEVHSLNLRFRYL